jgi:hypothetical protein
MNNNREFERFLPEKRVSSEKIIFEVPPTPLVPQQERIPLGYAPMSEIHLRGRAFRNLAGGETPWWVIFTGGQSYSP